MKKRILYVATFPPPVHGSAMMSQFIKDSRLINESFDFDYVNLSTSRRIDEIGKKSIVKVWRLIIALFIEFWKLLTRRYDLCYFAITCHGKGFLKDASFVLLSKILGHNVVIHQHNKGMANDVGIWPYRWLLPLCYNDAKVVLLSWRLYPDIKKIVPKENVFICPNGIPKFEIKYEERRNNDVPHLLFLSNLLKSKGVIVLLDALKIVHDKGLAFNCDIVGAETKELDSKQLHFEIIQRGLSNNVVYYGRRTGDEKREILMNSDIFVLPTFYENECFPLVLLEAMQFGLPIVSTDEGGILDMVNDGVNGLICKKNNPDSLAICLEKLIHDEKLRNKMGNNGFNLFKKKYTIECFEKNLIQILNNVEQN